MQTKNSKSDSLFQALNSIEGDEALEVLKGLGQKSTKTAAEIEKTIQEMLNEEIDVDEIASDVQADLEMLDVKDVWDSAGKDRYGHYTDPSEAADEMFSETIEPYREKLRRYLALGKSKHAKKCCKGILKGIYLFEEESDSEYKGWAPDCAAGYFSNIRKDWEENCKSKSGIKNVRAFIEAECLGWK